MEKTTIGQAESVQSLKCNLVMAIAYEHQAETVYKARKIQARRAWNYLNGQSLEPVDKYRAYTMAEYRYFSSLALDALKAYERARDNRDALFSKYSTLARKIAIDCNADAGKVIV